MGLNLTKGQSFSLTKEVPGLKNIVVGLGWDAATGSNPEADLDASAFLCKAGKCTGSQDFVFFNQKEHPSGAVKSTGDNRTGDGDGDDEQLIVDLSKMPADIDEVNFTVSIYDAVNRRQNFGCIENAYIRVIDQATGKELCNYDLDEEFSVEDAVIIAKLYKNGSEWEFAAIGQGFNGNLEGLTRHFGL